MKTCYKIIPTCKHINYIIQSIMIQLMTQNYKYSDLNFSFKRLITNKIKTVSLILCKQENNQ